MKTSEGGVVSMSVASGSKVGWAVRLADALAEVEGAATALVGSAMKRGTLAEGTGRGMGKDIAGGESTHIGVGDSLLQEGSWKEMVEVIAGVEMSEIDVEVMTEYKRPPILLSGIPKM